MKYKWQEVPDGTKYTDGSHEGQIIDSTEWGDIQVIDGVSRLVNRNRKKPQKLRLSEPIEYALFQWERSAICAVGAILIMVINT